LNDSQEKRNSPKKLALFKENPYGIGSFRNIPKMDFVIEGDDKSMHILNAVSPAFTCSIPFAQHTCNEIKSHLN
jgi:hypothetical protein